MVHRRLRICRPQGRQGAARRTGSIAGAERKMHCFSCGAENPDGLKFCNECGAPLKRRCPTCDFDNAPTAKFCGECAASLTVPASRLDPPKAPAVQAACIVAEA